METNIGWIQSIQVKLGVSLLHWSGERMQRLIVDAVLRWMDVVSQVIAFGSRWSHQANVRARTHARTLRYRIVVEGCQVEKREWLSWM